MKHLDRYDISTDGMDSKLNDRGLIFVHPKYGKVVDLYQEQFTVLGTYIDTLRQLYHGSVNLSAMDDLQYSIDFNERFYEFLGQDWLLSKSGKASGYQYKLQNNDIGLVILFKMFHAKPETPSSHLKIECSPWFLDRRSPEEVEKYLNKIANKLLVSPKPNYPAIHLAVDVQGWFPPEDFVNSVKCRSRRISQYNTFDSLEFKHSDISCTYDRCQSFKFGAASSVQLAVYNKTVQSRVVDKLDYMEHKWTSARSTEKHLSCQGYDSEKDVTRIELRFHHSVIRQFSEGTYDIKTGEVGVCLTSYKAVCKHLNGLWQYGLESFKYCHNSNYIAPIWTILQSDIEFSSPEIFYQDNLYYKRYYKKASSCSGKNYQLILGNFLSACARKRLTFMTTLSELQKMIIWEDIAQNYESKGVAEGTLIERLFESYTSRLLYGCTI
ncbi:hypothetical protein [Endozoicomonas arenosclerae]|uniref:hypothetical protein n=1 Tax=Endozoicomonas arenosclerae TaxID=1633495 RepID=UPI0007834074|nr:hypothetical protein [Endozoicomonas arenosclerae]